MGRRYYCDYCDKTMSCAPSIIKTHNNGLFHQRAKQEHFQKFKDPETILAEESRKKTCARFATGQCQFGSICRFSHYTPENIQALQTYVATKELANTMVAQPCFEELYNKLQTQKSSQEDGHTNLIDSNGLTHTFPWTYNAILDSFGESLPPSVRRITIGDFDNAFFNEWGR